MISGDTNGSTYCALAIESSNSSKNLLTKERADIIYGLNQYVLENMTLLINGRRYHFGKEICPKISFCPKSNKIVERFIDAYFDEQLSRNPKVALTYPVMEYFGNKFFLPNHLYGVETVGDSQRVIGVEMIHLVYAIPSLVHHHVFSSSDNRFAKGSRREKME